MPLLRDYIAEHERAINSGGDAVRAIDRGDLAQARHLLAEMATELAAHWLGEETGLFRVMSREEMYAEHIAPLVREHRELAELLATVEISTADGKQAIRDAMSDLYEHISKEEDGLFPPADRARRRRVGRIDRRMACRAPRQTHDRPVIDCTTGRLHERVAQRDHARGSCATTVSKITESSIACQRVPLGWDRYVIARLTFPRIRFRVEADVAA